MCKIAVASYADAWIKGFSVKADISASVSHPLRMRGLKEIHLMVGIIYIHGRTSYEVRGLKDKKIVKVPPQHCRILQGMRGLKFVFMYLCRKYGFVAFLAGCVDNC